MFWSQAIVSTESVLEEAQQNLQEVTENPSLIGSYFEKLVPDIIGFAIQVVLAFVVYGICAKLIKMIVRFAKNALLRRNADVGVIQFLTAMIKYILYVVLFMTILNIFGVATTSVVALLGSAGLTIGLALQGSLSNFAGGVLILLMKPFKVGDYIIQGEFEGTVYEISICYTKLKTADNRVVVIPNGNLSNNSLTNVSHMDRRRVDIVVGIGYEADIRKAKEVLFEVAQKDSARIPEEDAIVFVDNLGASSVDMGIRVWVNADDYWSAKWRMTENVKYALDENHISIPYQQIDVQIKQ